MKTKTYVIKNIVTKKYSMGNGKWTKDLFKADTFTQEWVEDKEGSLGKNEWFVAVKMIEAWA